MATSYNTISVASTATVIVAANAARRGIIISNNGSATLFVGPDANITTSNAIPILAATTLVMSGDIDTYKSAIYGIVSSGTVDARFFEWER